MPRLVTRYVDPDAAVSGNGRRQALSGAMCAYKSLSIAEAAEQRDLVTADEICRLVCSSNLDQGGGNADTTDCTFSGWTTDADRYIQAEATSSHGGKWNTGIYRRETGDKSLYVREGNIRVSGVQICVIGSGNCVYSDYSYVATGEVATFDKCIFRAASLTGYGRGFYHYSDGRSGGGGFELNNCLFYDFNYSTTTQDCAFRVYNTGETQYLVRNCTFHNSYIGIYQQQSGTVSAVNCGFASCISATSGTVGQTTCSTTTPTFVNEAADDFHLAGGDTTWRRQGTDLSAYFTKDIDGEVRYSWSIGADDGVAETVTRYVDPDSAVSGDGTTQTLSGGNHAYKSLAIWEAAEQANLVTADEIARAVCSSNLDAGGGTADTTTCTVNGWTTGPENYTLVEANSSHSGGWDSGIYRIAVAGAMLLCFEEYSRWLDIQMEEQSATGGAFYQYTAGGEVYLDRCILHSTGDGIGVYINTAGTTGYLWMRNCLIYDFTGGGSYGWATYFKGMTAYVLNCTFHSCDQSIYEYASTTGVTFAVNCGIASCGAPTSTVYLINCSTSTPTFVNEAGDDFHLQASDTVWKGAGLVLPGFTTDIDGDTRDEWSWCIGADEETTFATWIERFVDPDSAVSGDGTTDALSGGNHAYKSLSIAEAAEQQDNVTPNERVRFICASNQDAGGGSADGTTLNIDGWTVAGGRSVSLEAASAHGGLWNDDIYRLASSAWAIGISSSEAYIQLIGIQVKLTHATNGGPCIQLAGGSLIDNCISVSEGFVKGGVRAGFNVMPMDFVRNCIVYDCAQAFYCASYSGVASFVNCTAIDSTYGFRREYGTVTLINCGASGCSTGIGGTVTQVTCSSSSPTFLDESGDDFHLAANDETWRAGGTDLSFLFDTDIDGEQRVDWDIGADECWIDIEVSAGLVGPVVGSRIVVLSPWHNHVVRGLAC